MNPTEDDYFRAVGYYKGTGLSEDQAHAKAELEMEDYDASGDLQQVQQRRSAGSLD